MKVNLLRELFRHLQEWESTYESDGVDELTYDGVTISLWDVKKLYEESQRVLPRRQREAINLFLYQNVRERDAAVMMGVSVTNPIAMYATKGLEKIIILAGTGGIRGFRLDPELERL